MNSLLRCVVYAREECHVSENVQCSRDSKSKRSSNLESAHWILDIIENVVRVLPSVIREKNFEHRSCVLEGHQRDVLKKPRGGINVIATVRTVRKRMAKVLLWVFDMRLTREDNPA